MGDNLKRCIHELSYIANLSPKLRKQALSQFACNDCYFKAIKEIAKNIISKNIIPLNKRKIKSNWKNIIEVSGINKVKKRPKYIKRKLVNQSGGWIWSVIPVVLSILSTISDG